MSTVDNKFFAKQWQIYQKVLNHDYMNHRDIYDAVHRELIRRFPRPFSLLDLGSGDAFFMAEILPDTQIEFYQGIDLSESALDLARKNLTQIQGKKIFTCGDVWEILPELVNKQNNSFDIVLASFVLHHLNFEEKDYLINCIFNLLKNNGVFFYIDAFKSDREDRQTYLNRYINDINTNWTMMNSEEIESIIGHICECDFPETENKMKLVAKKHGFNKFECLYRDSLDIHNCYLIAV